MASPKISVILPVYNAVSYLRGSITSILKQTFSDFELIVIDDGSQDESLKVIQELLSQDPRIFLIKNKKNQGLTRSLNQGIRRARGKYIARQDADDLSYPKRLEYQHNYLERHPGVFLIGSGAEIIDQKGRKIGQYHRADNPGKIARRLKKYNLLFHSSIMFRNQKIFYREKFYFAQDYDLYLSLLSQNKKITNLPLPLIKHRQNPKSITKAFAQKQRAFARKACQFYKQRTKSGQDQYAKFNPEKILNKPSRKLRFFGGTPANNE